MLEISSAPSPEAAGHGRVPASPEPRVPAAAAGPARLRIRTINIRRLSHPRAIH